MQINEMRFNADRKLNSLYYFHMKLQRTRVFFLLFLLVWIAESTDGNGSAPANVTYAPPPPINQTVVAVFNSSPIGQRLIVSRRFENFQVSQNNNNASQLVSNFRINYFDRLSPNNTKPYSIANILGNWSFLASTTDTLSCSLVYESNNGIYGFIAFDPKNQKFQFVFNGTNTSLPLPVQNYSFTAMPQRITLGTGCKAGIFNGQIFSLNITSRSWSPVVVPTNWTVQGGSESMQYVVSQNKLYKYNASGNSYAVLQTLKSYQAFQVNQFDGRIIVAGYNTTVLDNRTNQVNQSIFVFDDKPSQLNNIGTLDISGQSRESFIPVVVSPKATKIGYMGVANDSSPAFLIKQIDYNSKKIGNITPTDPQHLLTTLKGSSLREIQLGDFYLVARNVTGPPPPINGTNATNATNSTPFEQAYQFVGNQLMFFRGRNLSGNEITNWNRLAIDPFYTNSLMVLNAYNITGGLEVHQFDYGNLAASNKIIPPVAPPFLTFLVPASTRQANPDDNFAWTYVNNLAGPISNFSIFILNRNSTNKLTIINFTINGNWSILAQNPSCLLIADFTANNYTLMKFDNATNNFKIFVDLSSKVSALNVTIGSKWLLSDKGDRFAVDRNIFSNQLSNATNYRPITNNLTNFMWTALDRNLTTAISNNSLWNYNDSLGGFSKFYDSPIPYLPQNRIITLQNKIVVSSLNDTAAQVVAYVNNVGANLTECLRFSFSQYLNQPDIQISTNLTKILIIGPFTPPNTTDVKPKIDAFFVDYDRKVATNITFPYETIRNPRTTYIRIEEEFLYIRQLVDNTTNSTDPRQEFVFFLDKNIVAKLVAKVNITTPNNVIWKKSLIQKTPEGKIYIQTETLEGNVTMNVVIVEAEVSAGQASLNSNGNGNQVITGVIIDGKVKLCSPGCSDCSSGTCSDCFTRYVFDTNTATCLSCGMNCLYCSSSNTDSCSSCLKGAYLSGTSCLPCDPSCVTCTGTATTCDICPPGKYFSGSNCSSCPKNCFNCSSSTVCITCQPGFAPDPTGKCRGCSLSCSSCNPANITQCTTCAHGLELINSVCVPCPDKCVSCTNGICALCIPGYQLSSTGVCVSACNLPCASCADNQPSVCTGCYSGSTLSGGSCTIDLSCNTNSSCTDCGIGLNYVRVVGQCVSCAQIDNCIQCSDANTQLCAICAQGYFRDGTSGCTACPATCSSCISSTLCMSCTIGYSLAQDQTQGACLQCVSPCASCIGSPTYCTSCVSGFTKQGWKCQNNSYVGFTLVLNTLATNILGNIDAIVTEMIALDKTNQTDVSSITFISILDGSAIVSGTVTGASTSDLSAGLSLGSTLGGYSIQSSTVVSYGSTTSQEAASSLNLPLIIGLCVSLPLLVIALIVGVVLYKRRKSLVGENVVMEVGTTHGAGNQMIDDESLGSRQPITTIHVEQQESAGIMVMEKEA